MHHSHPHTDKHTSAGFCLHGLRVFISLRESKLSRSFSFLCRQEHMAKIFSALVLPRVPPQNAMNVFTAKVGVRVYPLASHNIDKAVLYESKLQPCRRNTGRQTGGCMSMWGAYRPIKAAAAPVLIDRPWWTAERERGRISGVIRSTAFKGETVEVSHCLVLILDLESRSLKITKTLQRNLKSNITNFYASEVKEVKLHTKYSKS